MYAEWVSLCSADGTPFEPEAPVAAAPAEAPAAAAPAEAPAAAAPAEAPAVLDDDEGQSHAKATSLSLVWKTLCCPLSGPKHDMDMSPAHQFSDLRNQSLLAMLLAAQKRASAEQGTITSTTPKKKAKNAKTVQREMTDFFTKKTESTVEPMAAAPAAATATALSPPIEQAESLATAEAPVPVTLRNFFPPRHT
jgi:hypothetical protein